MFQLKQLYIALGFGADEFGKVNGKLMLGRRALTKIKVSTNENGFWEFRLNNMKPIGDGSGVNEFAQPTGNSSSGGKTAEQLAAEELAKELG
jgi:hypothetical protein